MSALRHTMIDDLSEHPGDELVREVFAHVGLCLYLAQCVETALIGVLAALATAKHAQPIRKTFDELHERYETFTLGNLLKELARHGVASDELMRSLRDVKDERDYLAHRIFRDRAVDFAATGGCLEMIQELMARRDRLIALDDDLYQLFVEAYARTGADPRLRDQRTSAEMSKMLASAREKYGRRGT